MPQIARGENGKGRRASVARMGTPHDGHFPDEAASRGLGTPGRDRTPHRQRRRDRPGHPEDTPNPADRPLHPGDAPGAEMGHNKDACLIRLQNRLGKRLGKRLVQGPLAPARRRPCAGGLEGQADSVGTGSRARACKSAENAAPNPIAAAMT